MKKQILTTFLCASAIVLIAQPTITSGVNGGVGDEITFMEIQPEGLNSGAVGANVTWDYSDIIPTGFEYGFTIVDAATTPQAASFPGANVAADNGLGSLGYSKITATEFTNYGSYAGDVLTYYDDPEEIFVFPLTFGTTNIDDLHSNFFSGADWERSGTTTMEADGYGTLILPSGTYTDVLRVKVYQDYQDETDLLPTPIEYDFTLYYWFKEGYIGALFEYFELNVGGAFPSETTAAALNAALPVGINASINADKLSVSPNPVTDMVNIELPVAISNTQVRVYNSLGQLVVNENLNPSGNIITLNMQDYTAGIYFVEVSDGEKTYKTKIVKK
ncbi:MAG: T9SS type A sorting domain-containing protein [Bacteroidetes bacterium]|nr:T9SS type A sorting domain-containing protein [Bacteroidota bacterium]